MSEISETGVRRQRAISLGCIDEAKARFIAEVLRRCGCQWHAKLATVESDNKGARDGRVKT